ncbi:hypothetical protein OC861_003984 [Tilletia horrida]|nr:hypothetical protein OC861_003984 [Tilletia horrida]
MDVHKEILLRDKKIAQLIVELEAMKQELEDLKDKFEDCLSNIKQRCERGLVELERWRSRAT